MRVSCRSCREDLSRDAIRISSKTTIWSASKHAKSKTRISAHNFTLDVCGTVKQVVTAQT